MMLLGMVCVLARSLDNVIQSLRPESFIEVVFSRSILCPFN